MGEEEQMNEMRLRYKQQLEAFYGVAVDCLRDEKVKVWFGLSHGLVTTTQAEEA